MNARTLLFVALLVCTAGRVQAQDDIPTMNFGIVPQQAASKLAETWGPLLAEVGRRAGVHLTFRTAPTIPAFEERLNQGEYDIAYMNPYHYVVFHQSAGYQAFAKEKDRKIKGIIVVKQDSYYKKPADLAGKDIAFPAPAAFAASILPQAEFGRLGISINTRFVASHDSVYRAVAAGIQEAGGGIQRTFEATAPEIRAQLRVLTETPAYTPHAFAAHSRVTPAVLVRVQAAMLSLADDDVGRKLLKPLAMAKGFSAAADQDWNDIRALDVHQLEKYGKK